MGNGLQGKADNRALWLVRCVFPKEVPGELGPYARELAIN